MERRHIYALSIVDIIPLTEKGQPVRGGLYLVNNKKHTHDGLDDYDLDKKKIYLELYLQKNKRGESAKAIGFLDSGSDVTLIQKPYIDRLLTMQYIEKHKNTLQTSELSSYSQHTIKILYSILIYIRFRQEGEYIPCTFYVISEIVGSPLLLIGRETQRQVALGYGFTGQKDKEIPEVFVHRPVYTIVKTHYVTDESLFKCSGLVELGPGEEGTFRIYLSQATPCQPRDMICINTEYKSSHPDLKLAKKK